jgi:hypothetical protein
MQFARHTGYMQEKIIVNCAVVCDVAPCSPYNFANISKEGTDSFFSIKRYAKQELLSVL